MKINKPNIEHTNGCKSTIDLKLANLTITPDYKWSKEYELIEDESEIYTKTQSKKHIAA